MRAYTGTDRIHDRMDREADDEKSYNYWELKVLGKMRPDDISEWLWRANWSATLFRKDFKQAMHDAKQMAVEIGELTVIKQVEVEDRVSYYAAPENMGYTTSASCNEFQFNFRIRLIKERRFPDISKHAGNDSDAVSRHQGKTIKRYQKMAADNFKPTFSKW